jgi:hypothetical protein
MPGKRIGKHARHDVRAVSTLHTEHGVYRSIAACLGESTVATGRFRPKADASRSFTVLTIGDQLFLKILASIAIALALIVVAGLSGLSFYVWPTNFNDHKLSITPDVVERLRKLQSERKFGPDAVTFYPGAMNESQRLAAQAVVDSTIQALIAELPTSPRRSTVLRVMKLRLANFDTSESEERDQVLAYLSKVMQICGVQSSAELFNIWRYGFPYGWFF